MEHDKLPPLPEPDHPADSDGCTYACPEGFSSDQMRAYAAQAVAAERDILRTENAALKREAHTWSKAAEHYAKPLEPLDPLDIEELWDVANGDPYVDEVHQAFARLIEHKHGIGG